MSSYFTTLDHFYNFMSHVLYVDFSLLGFFSLHELLFFFSFLCFKSCVIFEGVGNTVMVSFWVGVDYFI